MAKGVTVPSGWTRQPSPSSVVVYHRDQPSPYPGSRLSFVPTGTTVTSAGSDGLRHEHVEVSETGDGGALVFAMLGWPGWTATFDGRSVPVGRNAVGLLTVQLPPHSSGRLELAFLPPGLRVGLAAASVGLIGAVALGWFGRRRRDDEDDEGDEGDVGDESDAGDESGAVTADERPDDPDAAGQGPREEPEPAPPATRA
jgi:hypothetical protein